jgi:hypothetical protein
MTKIKLLKAWRIWSAGHIIPEMPENISASLVARGIAEIVNKPSAAMRAGRDYITRKAGKP